MDELNPGVLQLKAHKCLRLSIKIKKAVESQPDANLDARFQMYKVQPKETFYSLTRRFQVSKDSLVAWNPQLEKEGLQAGMSIKIPKKAKELTPSNNAEKIDFE